MACMLISNDKTTERGNELQKEQESSMEEKIRMMRFVDLYLENNNGYWTEEEEKKLSSMFHMGTGISQIALELGRTERTVVQKINALNSTE